MNSSLKMYSLLLGLALIAGCGSSRESNENTDSKPVMEKLKHSVIFDTDANNELDDQHALAYLLLNGNDFDVKGVTVNATRSGGNIDQHYLEAERVIKLCDLDGKIPLL